MKSPDRDQFVDLIIRSWRQADQFLRRRLGAGEPAFVDAWKPRGGEKALDEIGDWLSEHQGSMLAAVV